MTLVTDVVSRSADTDAPLLSALVERWSPRAYDRDAVIAPETLTTILEAARWAPSANNSQPWRFAVTGRGEAAFSAVHDALLGFNQTWADSAAAFIVNIAEVADEQGNPLRWATYDLGQAVAHLTIQAQHEGLHTHQMGGFDAEALRLFFGLSERFEVVSITALGVLGSIDSLSEALRAREVAPRVRRPLDEIVISA